MITGWPEGSPRDQLHREAIRVQMAIAAAQFAADKPAAEILFEDYLLKAGDLGVSIKDAWMVYAVAAKYWVGSMVNKLAEVAGITPLEMSRFLAVEAAADVGVHAG